MVYHAIVMDNNNPYLDLDDKEKSYNLNLLRGWQRSQLKLLKEFTVNTLVSQTRMAGASGTAVQSHELGGKITALTRADLIQKAGKDENGQWLWQLNEQKIERQSLKEFLDSLHIE